MARRDRLATILGLLLMAFLFAANVWRMFSLGMDKHPPFWVVDAIPPALSDLRFGGRGDYTVYNDVSDVFYKALRAQSLALDHDSGMVQRSMAAVMALDPSRISRKTVLLGGEDKGIVDFVKIAFRLFGFDCRRIVYLYYAILAGSLSLLVGSFAANRSVITFACAFLTGHYLLQPIIFSNPQLQSVLALRFLPVLALMACLHSMLFAQRPVLSPGGIAALVLQVLLLIFAVHLRSVTLWQIAVAVAFGVAVAGVTARRQFKASDGSGLAVLRNSVARYIPHILPAILLVAGLLALNVYRHRSFDVRYLRGDQPTTRVFWHNILSGYAFNPNLAGTYGLKIDDSSEARAARAFLVENRRAAEWTALGGTPVDKPWVWGTGFYRLRLTAYDRVAGELFWSIVLTHPAEAIATFVFYKPAALLRQLAWVYGFRREMPDVPVWVSADIGDAMAVQLADVQKTVDSGGSRLTLWAPTACLTILVLTLVQVLQSRLSSPLEWLPAAALVLGSIIPSIVGYPGLHTISEPVLLFAAAIFSAVSVSLSWAIKRAFGARSPPR